jgi:DNA polymerase-3 subunit delta'
VSGFGSIIDQERPLRILTTILRGGNIPHALLFTGIEGVGKHTAAITFAMALNCTAPAKIGKSAAQDEKEISTPNGPCAGCRPCKKIQTGSHPDIIPIKPQGQFIRIDQIRDLCRILSLKPYEARRRVVIVSDAHTMNPSAGNALLKILEEPPDQTILILIALRASELLPTILSRCQHIRFNPISRENLKAFLMEEEGMDSDGATVLATLANGSLSKARSLSRANWINRRKWLIKACGLDSSDALSSSSVGSLLAFAEKLSKNKELLGESLEIIKSYLRDLVVWKYCPDRIINKDFMDWMPQISRKNSQASLLSKIEAIHEVQRDIQTNTNLRLALDVLILRIAYL